MSEISNNIKKLLTEIPSGVRLVAVSKTKPAAAIQEAYNCGQRIFGENYVQELEEKQPPLPKDIEWHFIGHLQSNKVKYIAPFVDCIHAVDSEKLLAEIQKQVAKHNRKVCCLLQVHIALEETKFGWDAEELSQFCRSTDFSQFPNIEISGLMSMASNTDDVQRIRTEFKAVKTLFDALKTEVFTESASFCELSMGMSSDWKYAVEEGSTLIRIGSTIFGNR
jgi:PLP dependent protein